jgi:hypothetical protein
VEPKIEDRVKAWHKRLLLCKHNFALIYVVFKGLV